MVKYYRHFGVVENLLHPVETKDGNSGSIVSAFL